jgi:hypothetical protein
LAERAADRRVSCPYIGTEPHIGTEPTFPTFRNEPRVTVFGDDFAWQTSVPGSLHAVDENLTRSAAVREYYVSLTFAAHL